MCAAARAKRGVMSFAQRDSYGTYRYEEYA